jgi:hypothetical protein
MGGSFVKGKKKKQNAKNKKGRSEKQIQKTKERREK